MAKRSDPAPLPEFRLEHYLDRVACAANEVELVRRFFGDRFENQPSHTTCPQHGRPQVYYSCDGQHVKLACRVRGGVYTCFRVLRLEDSCPSWHERPPGRDWLAIAENNAALAWSLSVGLRGRWPKPGPMLRFGGTVIVPASPAWPVYPHEVKGMAPADRKTVDLFREAVAALAGARLDPHQPPLFKPEPAPELRGATGVGMIRMAPRGAALRIARPATPSPGDRP